MWPAPDGQYQNQIDYILCSQRWRSSIQSEKIRPEADCGSDHELIIAKFRLILKKVGKITRPFRYDLNKILNNYAVVVTNSFCLRKEKKLKAKGEKERYIHLNSEFQKRAKRDKKAFLGDQYKEIEETNRFPGNSDGKASAHNVGDLGSIPGSRRSPGEGNGNPLQ